MVDALDGVVSGQYDGNIAKLIEWVSKTGTPVFLRIGYEFDGSHNHYAPAQYIKAYQYIVDKFRASRVDNVAFVWHSYAGYVEGSRLRWYPGDEYVDWIAISYFDPYNKSNMEKIARLAKSKNKPFMIAEATPKGYTLPDDGKAWKLWFERLFSFIEKNHVEALSYINTNWEASPIFRGQGWGDSRIQANAGIKEKWLSALSR